jgi:microcystin-dependent protein
LEEIMDPFVGQIMQVGFNFAPTGWAQCLGQTLAISQNQALFALIGTYYGGNGVTTFQLPNFQSRVAVGTGQGLGLSVYVLGQTGGNESVILTVNQMPSHSHLATYTAPTATLQAYTAIPVGQLTSTPAAGSQLSNTNDATAGGLPQIYAPATSGAAAVNLGGLTMTGGSVTNGLTGNNQPTPTLPPYLAITTNIALVGVFPSRN